ncbi:exopolysaccharide production protein ExoQ [Rhizobiales bacterium GAS113]|nr:exopolysaccharide production protein ExoQ [Rhizobiales bacterium GAS113]
MRPIGLGRQGIALGPVQSAARIIPGATLGLSLNIAWLAWFIATAALFFLQMSQTLAASIFMAISVAYVMARPGLALQALRGGVTPWIYVTLAVLSVAWSEHSDVSARAAVQIAFTMGAALVMARALPARSTIFIWMSAVLAANAASLLNPQMAWNAGALAMIGIFGSKNQLGLSQAILVMAGAWIFLDRERAWPLRCLALFCAFLGATLMIAARSLDATATLIAALGCALVSFRLNWVPRRWRAIVLFAVVFVVVALLALLLVYANEFGLFGQVLQLSGKDVTLSGRTELWQRAAVMMEQNPILGTGLQAFWVQGNPYAEELWARFAPGRAGYHFHNLWYETGVELGYVGLLAALYTVISTSLEVWRWVIRTPNVASCFFLTYVIFIDMRTFVEVDLFGQYSFNWVLYLVSWAYARRARWPYQRQPQLDC